MNLPTLRSFWFSFGVISLLLFYSSRGRSDDEQIYSAPCDAQGHIDIPEELSGIPDGCFNTCISPWDPYPPLTCPPGGNAGGPGGSPGGMPGGNPGGGPGGCPSCPPQPIAVPVGDNGGGMPRWFVTEPHVNLHLADKPLWYRPSRGKDVQFELFFKNRSGANGTVDNAQYLIFSVGKNWHTPWRSYLQERLTSFGPGGTHMLYLGNGAVHHVAPGYVDLESSAKFVEGEDDTYELRFRDGSRNVYGPRFTISGTDLWFLSKIQDSLRNTITLSYAFITNGSVRTVRLNKVTDVDGLETTFEYATSGYYSNLITKVISPYGAETTLKYDSSSRLTNVVDVVQLTNSFYYDSSNRLSSFVTPYGTNEFQYYSGSTNWAAIRVTELGVRNHLYLQGDGPTNLFPSAVADHISLTNYLWAAGIVSTFDATELNKRCSYYWGPRQYGNLSSPVLTNLTNLSFTIADLSTNDYNKGRSRHWLAKITDPHHSTPVIHFASGSVSLERQPSPLTDGSTQGKMIWYDYEGKEGAVTYWDGWSMFPQTVAWRLPGSDWHIDYVERHWTGVEMLHKSNFGPPGNVLWRTNTYTISPNWIDVTRALEDGVMVSSNVVLTDHIVMTNYNAFNEITSYTYDNDFRLTSIRRPTVWITTNIYDGNGFLSAVIELDSIRTNSMETFTYTNGLVLTRTDANGRSVTNSYDALGRRLTEKDSRGTVTYSYNKLDLVSVVDRLGFTNRYVYDGFRQLLFHTNANGGTNVWQYCSCGSLEASTDAMGNPTTYSYDNAGRRTRTTFPTGRGSIDYSYDVADRVNRETDALGVAFTNCFTVNNLIFAVSNSFGQAFWKQFDSHDRILHNVDQNGVEHGFDYDALGRVTTRTNMIEVEEILGDFEVDTWAERYDYTNYVFGPVAFYHEKCHVSILDGEIDPESIERERYGGWITNSYDALGRRTNEVHFNTNNVAVMTNRFRYDGSGKLTNLFDGKAQVTTWAYDKFGAVTNKKDANGAEAFSYTYDANGRLSSRTMPVKGTTSYSYDGEGNLTGVNYPTDTDLTFTYDGNNRLLTMVDVNGTTTYAYTTFGPVQSEDGPWADDKVDYTYSLDGLRATMGIAQPNGPRWVANYVYDTAKRLNSIASPAGTFSYQYSAGLKDGVTSSASVIQRLSLPGGSAITNMFDQKGRWVGTWLRNNSGTLLNQHLYEYDILDHRTRQTRQNGDYVDYGYDGQGQLVDATGKESGGATKRWHELFGYAYDAAGNLKYRTNNGLVQTFTVNSLNQLSNSTRSGTLTVAGASHIAATNVTVNTQTADRYADNAFARTNLSLSDGNNTFTAVGYDALSRTDTTAITAYLPATANYQYDSNGNLIFDGLRGFAYDDENQLVRVTVTNDWKTEFVYDGKMRRRVRKEYSWQNGAWGLDEELRYVYDRNLVIQERDRLNVSQVTYTRGKDLSGSLEGAGGIGGLLARTDNALLVNGTARASAYYSADGNGNITCLVDTNQIVVARYTFDPFGNTLAATGPMAEANLYRFSSKELHLSSGLVYYLYRFYDPNIQRWPNRDPIGEADDLNLYAFVANSPIDWWDPFGLKRDCNQEDIDCNRQCMKNPCPFETADDPPKVNKWKRVAYCESLCLKKYMECEKENEEKQRETERRRVRDPHPFGPPVLRRPFGGGFFVNPGIVGGGWVAVGAGGVGVGAGIAVAVGPPAVAVLPRVAPAIPKLIPAPAF